MYEGCERGNDQGKFVVKGCLNGRACGGRFECIGCSFEQCRDRAISQNKYAFSYRGTGDKWCYMCDRNQVKLPWKYADYGIYTKPDKGILIQNIPNFIQKNFTQYQLG